MSTPLQQRGRQRGLKAYIKVSIQRPGHEDFTAQLADSDFFSKRVGIGDRVMARWAIAEAHLLEAEHGRLQHWLPQQLLSQCLGLPEVGGVKALGEPAVDGGE
jgi:hypothetical protein